MRNRFPRTRTVLLLATLGAVIVGTGVATGAIPGADGTITACYNVRTGTVQVIDAESGATCANNERQLSWNQSGPVGPAGAKGDKGDPGPQGAASCDASRLLLCPDADLPSGQTLSVTSSGFEILAGVSSYRINCTTSGSPPTACELVLTGAASASLEVDAWYEAAALGQPSATRSFTLTIFDSSSKPIRKFFVTDGRPTALLHQGDRRQITFKSEHVQRVLP